MIHGIFYSYEYQALPLYLPGLYMLTNSASKQTFLIVNYCFRLCWRRLTTFWLMLVKRLPVFSRQVTLVCYFLTCFCKLSTSCQFCLHFSHFLSNYQVSTGKPGSHQCISFYQQILAMWCSSLSFIVTGNALTLVHLDGYPGGQMYSGKMSRLTNVHWDRSLCGHMSG